MEGNQKMKGFKGACVDFAINRSKLVILTVAALTMAAACFFPSVVMDTDPENMLMTTQPARVFHNKTKKDFDLSEIVVLGIVNEKHPDGVFNPQTLGRIFKLTEFAKTLRWPDKQHPGKTQGVIEIDMIAPSMAEHMSQVGQGTISFDWLMPAPPQNSEQALEIKRKVLSNPLLTDRMVSSDGKALCLYLPLTDKMLSYKVYTSLRKKIKQLGGDEEYHVTGLPVAEGAIGVEMFTQMGLGSALSMAVIFALLFIFFKKWFIVILPMIIATVSIFLTMGAMIACGYPVHILSSMIPIFLMSISMVDSVHVLSEFFDVYTPEKGRRQTVKQVMTTLFNPMLYTSLTTAAGFYSLTLSPIPPAQVFGTFLSVGALVAWFATILFVPAYISLIPERWLKHFGLVCSGTNSRQNMLTRVLKAIGLTTYTRTKTVLCLFALLTGVAVYGITQIQINDNYAKRFIKSHPVRKADTALNRHFAGTYTAYLVFESPRFATITPDTLQDFNTRLDKFATQLRKDYPGAEQNTDKLQDIIQNESRNKTNFEDMLDSTIAHIEQKHMSNCTDEEFDFYQEIIGFLGIEQQRLKTFKRPDVLNYMLNLQKYLTENGYIGKATSVADVVCKVNQELTDGKRENFRIPEKLQTVAECYMQFQQSHRPHDLWHMVTPGFKRAVIWLQFPSGNSKDTKNAVNAVRQYVKDNPPPAGITYNWAGLHYINLVLEHELVWGFLKSFAGSFVIVFLMMSFLFRSCLWGLLCMVPLSITLLMIYGVTGLIGKDYDLPIAVLSALSIGMAVDFAIHFLSRSKTLHEKYASWTEVLKHMFEEPARAITRNVLVIAIGFLPLLVAPLIPYKTTGIMLFGILALSGLITLVVLPAVLKAGEKYFFNKNKR